MSVVTVLPEAIQRGPAMGGLHKFTYYPGLIVDETLLTLTLSAYTPKISMEGAVALHLHVDADTNPGVGLVLEFGLYVSNSTDRQTTTNSLQNNVNHAPNNWVDGGMTIVLAETDTGSEVAKACLGGEFVDFRINNGGSGTLSLADVDLWIQWW